MKKHILYFALCISIMGIMSGCSFADGNHSIKKENKDSSMLGPILSNCSFVQLNGKIAFLTTGNEIIFRDEQEKAEKVVQLPENRQCLEIAAGKDYFYVFCSNEEETDGFLRIYDNDARLINEIGLPFKRVSVSNGNIFGYYDDAINDFFSWNSNYANSHIEATHYMSESEFLEKFSNKLSDWIEIKRNGKVEIGNIQFYYHPTDYYHTQGYYSNRKPLDVLEQIDYVRYCDGKLASEGYDTKVKSIRINQIYSMMRKKEKNFLIYSFQKNNAIYGVCNVYEEHGDLLSFLTKDLKYSFSFRYDEKKDKLYKKTEYNNIELIYEDNNHCLYHKSDGVYCKSLSTGENRKVYDYNGEIGITLLNGWTKFQERVASYDGNLVDKQEIKKIW